MMIHFGQFIDGHSIGHRLDVRVKIISVMLLSFLIFRVRGWEIFPISTFLIVVCLVFRLRFVVILKALKPLAFFAALLFGLHLFSTDGVGLVAIPFLPVRITQEGLFRGFLVSWQFMTLALSGAILTMTTSPSDLVHGLENLLQPLTYVRIPTQDIAVMVSMAMRFVPTFLEEFGRIRTAQMARGAAVGTGSLVGRLKALTLLVTPLMASVFRRADDLTEAMEARGYSRGTRTTLHRLHFGRADAAALAVMALLFFLTVISGVTF
jgi:energy-coupling factor transporter transmembrane protein EcfT